jgi:3-deoxy-manno-octulosonate cytidylyltransferase (CMP-KDO synthetase)
MPVGAEDHVLAVLGVIPARYGSTRFPGKPLADLDGKPLLAHVVERAGEARRIDRLVVATDDERIAAAARTAGAEAMLTPAELPSGSDRAAHVLERLGPESFDAVVNIQGDEPLLPGAAMDAAVALLEASPEAALGTLAVPADAAEAADPNVVKVVLDKRRHALYFSRAAIPHGGSAVLKHVGLYVFRPAYLRRWTGLGISALERAERLEQLRALEDGAAIVVAVGAWPVLGVDTPQDLERVRLALSRTREKERTA